MRPQLALEMLHQLCAVHPRQRFHAIADSAYGGQNVLKGCRLSANSAVAWCRTLVCTPPLQHACLAPRVVPASGVHDCPHPRNCWTAAAGVAPWTSTAGGIGSAYARRWATCSPCIHRDLKPSNVLVTQHDSKAVPKIIGFGVAKALNQQLTEHSIYTVFAQMIGTPAYMSPEQAEMSGLDVDTRSDIYALGVMLYELLTGSTPVNKQRLATVGLDEMRRIIREEEPEKPSTRLSYSKDALVSLAAQHRTEPAKLKRLMRGERGHP